MSSHAGVRSPSASRRRSAAPAPPARSASSRRCTASAQRPPRSASTSTACMLGEVDDGPALGRSTGPTRTRSSSARSASTPRHRRPRARPTRVDAGAASRSSSTPRCRACYSRRRSRTRPAASSPACARAGSPCSRTTCRRRSTSSGRRSCRPRSPCSSTAARACRGAWTSSATRRRRSPATCRRNDRIIVAPFSKTLETITGPTDDRQTYLDAHRGDRAGRRHGDPRLARRRRRKLISGVEGRHAIILLTDGYDEHSTREFDDALARVQSSGATVYVVGIGGVAGISLKGERPQAACRRDRRPGLLPVREIELARSTSSSRPTSRCATCSPTRRRTRRSTARGGEITREAPPTRS